MALDGLSTPALAEFIHVVLAVLVETDWLLRPLVSGQLALFAPLVDLVGLRAELVVDLARVRGIRHGRGAACGKGGQSGKALLRR